jgi:2-oxo-3-hexenedioate decarboxylase
MPPSVQPRERRMRPAAIGVALLAVGCAAGPKPEADYLKGFAEAERQVATFPAASEALPGLTLAEAYRLQDRIVRARLGRGDRVVGYKGGLMSAKSLADKGVTEPLTGVLFASGDLADGAHVSLCDYRRTALEMKLGYVFDRPVTHRLSNVEDLKTRVGAIQPVVELPDIAYRNGDAYSAVDMAAANVSVARFVRGAPHETSGTDIDPLPVTLFRNGVQVTRGLGRDSLGGQWASLLTVVNLVIAHGGRIEPGQLILTGKIGDKVAVPAGIYRADYGPLGTVGFQLDACPAR